MHRKPHHNLVDGKIGLGMEFLRRSRRNNQQCRQTTMRQAHGRQQRDKHNGNGRSVLLKWKKFTTGHDIQSARRRRRMQHQGQVQPHRTLLAYGKGSTAHSHDVPDMGKMTVFLRKGPVTASLIYTSQGEKRNEREVDIQSLELKHGGRGGVGGVG
jgi:hypothetical protein